MENMRNTTRPLLLLPALCLAGAALLGACARGSEPAAAVAAAAPAPTAAEPGVRVTESVFFQTSDGETLHAFVTGVDTLRPRPLIVEVSPYGGNGIPDFGADYNHVFVHARGTGRSTGAWSAVGPDDQRDVSEFLAWACTQPWSNGRIGLYGFSASAIAVYNSLHLPLACVQAAALGAGTHELYRDLLYPGGIPNIVPELVVGVGVGLPLLLSSFERFQDGVTPLQSLEAGLGLQLLAVDTLSHPAADDFWTARSQRPGPNHFPLLANTGFYDVESRGPFQSYQMLRDLGLPVHLRVFGAHDGVPVGTTGGYPEYRRWFERYLLDQDNGIDREPRVQFLVGHGGFEAQLAGAVTKYQASDWPVPGTRWQTLHLDAARGGGARSINDGQLSTAPVAAQMQQAYPAIASFPLGTDPNTTSTVTNGGGAAFAAFPFLTWQLLVAEPLALTYTSAPLTQDVDVVGPAALQLFLSSVLPEADIYAVLADVWPDGMAHAVGIGRLRTSFPDIVPERSLQDAQGRIVQPYPDHSAKTQALPGTLREYQVEFWPVGNRFQSGHRLRLYLVGAPSYTVPSPSLNLASVGGETPSRLNLPVLPGQDLCAALGASAC